MLPWPANITCDIYRSGNAPPANPDVNQASLHLVPCFEQGRETGESENEAIRFTHVAHVELATDLRDAMNQFAQGAGPDTVYVPDKNGIPLQVVFVERINKGTAQDCKRVYLQRKLPSWPLSANQCKGVNQNSAGQYAPTASFTPASGTTTDYTQAVSFTDTSAGYPTSWLWDFGDGNTSTSQNPSHTYSSPGSYTVTLTATNAYGSSQATGTVNAYINTSCVGYLPGTLHATITNNTNCACLNNLTITLNYQTGTGQWLGTATGLCGGSHNLQIRVKCNGGNACTGATGMLCSANCDSGTPTFTAVSSCIVTPFSLTYTGLTVTHAASNCCSATPSQVNVVVTI